ncbi:GNAT family N-acetyltransferase [Micromonospora echinofusca]|uniref:GNAT family N-acetyltransferase n=1 Tax=Micromonospora echinofusca TaxID=47858 RepID=A0ABS3W183_MICEH|nr:GNAT family N-acetyltransferase [Micromonospora echinofusca]MBO4210546.1 GNAT family N-acetyltransferase [Micromonospora echinofusca]
MPVTPDAGRPGWSLLSAVDGTPLARFRPRDDDGRPVAAELRPLPGADPVDVAARARHDLAGQRLETPVDAVTDALVAGGLTLRRAATELRHDLVDLPEVLPLPAGWSLTAAGWDDDLAAALTAAYGPGHPDGGWTPEDTRQVRAMVDGTDPLPPLGSASAVLTGDDGRSYGHVLCAGPVPWVEDGGAWILNIAVAPQAQGRGLGRALLTHALHGTRDAGLPTLGLSVADGNPARRLYDRAGFRPSARVLSVLLPPRAEPVG